MFQSVTRTWNPWRGCDHGCTYCWARDLATGRLQRSPKYKAGFNPRFHPTELNKTFRPGEFVFVVSMGDLWGSWVPAYAIEAILEVILRFPDTDFLLQTKNPARYLEFDLPPNIYAGVTIESDVPHPVSAAPSPHSRYRSMLDLPSNTKTFLSIEPIMFFLQSTFTQWILELMPDIIEIGADNHHKHLPEPRGSKVIALIADLRLANLIVKEKPGLERLFKESANV